MEDVLSVYTRTRDPDRPVVCLDETSKQLVAETRSPVAMRPGLPARLDYEYTRNGVANLFMMFAPLLVRRDGAGDLGEHPGVGTRRRRTLRRGPLRSPSRHAGRLIEFECAGANSQARGRPVMK